MSIYGYCRISTAKQSIDRQIRNIKAEYPTAHIVQEAYTGTSIFRPEWLKLYRVLKAGDTVVFDSVSRMSRNAEEGFALYEDLYHKGIRLVFLKEHHIDTETYKKALSGSIAMTGTNVDFIFKGINEYLMALAKEQIKLAFEQSEKEVADLPALTNKMIKAARKNLYNRKTGLFVGTGDKQISYASQIWMILSGVASKAEGKKALSALDTTQNVCYPGTPYMYHYYIQSLIDCGMNLEAKEALINYWGGMIAKGADTFWEAYDPTNDFISPYDFYPINSYCHAWSCTPVYFIRKYPEIFQK